MAENQHQKEQWHLSKSVNIGQIVSIMFLSIALMTAWSDVQKGINGNVKEIAHLRELQKISDERAQEIQAISDKRTHELKSDITGRLERFERKLDKLLQSASR